MGPEGAVEIIFKNDIGTPEKKEAKINEYREKFANPYLTASRGYIDEVIHPQNTRFRICRSLQMLRNKEVTRPWKKHDNLPL
jgi:propionyl-CoA carboxylase beta chain